MLSTIQYFAFTPLVILACILLFYFPIGSSLFLFLCLTKFAYSFFRSLKVSTNEKAVLITGCDSGFGNHLATTLHKIGFTVFACCLDDQSEGANQLKNVSSNQIHVIQMDITKQEQVDDAHKYVKANLQKGEALWGLVNNAGVCSLGFVEWLNMEDFEKMVAVNLFGAIRVTKRFAPLIRKSKGRIVNVSSMMGRASVHCLSAYCISKYGMEAFSNTLRREMRQFGVKVCTIQPGTFSNATGIFQGVNGMERNLQNLWNNLDGSLQDIYGRQTVDDAIALNRVMQEFPATDTSPVINAMTDCLSRLYPETHYFVGFWFDKLFVFLDELLPACITDSLFSFGEKCILYYFV